ncbi:hypothetical protein RJT80_00785 [Buchnera aphidicola (Periphyllus koelreuteriae)]
MEIENLINNKKVKKFLKFFTKSISVDMESYKDNSNMLYSKLHF